MPDPTAQQLHGLMQPIWDREPTLQVEDMSFVGEPPLDDVWICGSPCCADHATQLCESQMVRWLAIHAEKRINGICSGKDWSSVKILLDAYYEEFDAPTLVQALAAACTAVLDAKEREPG